MEIEKFNTNETAQKEMINKRLYRLKLTIDVTLWCTLAFAVLLGWNLLATDRLWQFIEEKAFTLILPLIAMSILCVVVSLYLDNCYRQYSCKICGYIYKPDLSELDNFAGALLCPQCNQKTEHEKILFHDEEINARTDKVKSIIRKPWVIVLICICVVGLFVFYGKPFVLTVNYEAPEIVSGTDWREEGQVVTFYADESGAHYYLTDGTNAYDYTVIYLNRKLGRFLQC